MESPGRDTASARSGQQKGCKMSLYKSIYGVSKLST